MVLTSLGILAYGRARAEALTLAAEPGPSSEDLVAEIHAWQARR